MTTSAPHLLHQLGEALGAVAERHAEAANSTAGAELPAWKRRDAARDFLAELERLGLTITPRAATPAEAPRDGEPHA